MVDGICDDVDDCVGEFDDCGICNGPVRSTTAVALTSRKAIATATATSLTPSAIAVVLVRPTPMLTAFATTSMSVLASWTLAASVMVLVRSMTVDVLTSRKATAIAMGISLMP